MTEQQRRAVDPELVLGVTALPLPDAGPGGLHDTADATRRRIEAVSLRLAGATYAQIAEHLGVTDPGTARHVVMRALSAVEAERVGELRSIENARLDQDEMVLRRIINDPKKKDETRLKAIDSRLRVAKRRADLNGLDAPKQVQISAGVLSELQSALGEIAELVQGEVVGDVSVEAVDRALEA